MNQQKTLAGLVRQWEDEGRWVDRGWWIWAKKGMLEYLPTNGEIPAKCRLFRAIAGWRGAIIRPTGSAARLLK